MATISINKETRNDLNKIKYELKKKSANETIEYLIRLFQESEAK